MSDEKKKRIVTPSRRKAIEIYNARSYERLGIRVHTGDREKLREAATAAGMSINMFVLQGRAGEVLDWLKEEDDEGEMEEA